MSSDHRTGRDSSGPARVLLVEPDSTRRQRLADWLAQVGHECHAVSDMCDAAEQLTDQKTDLVLLADRGSRMLNAEAMETCRNTAGLNALSVVVYGPDLDGSARAQLLSDGANEALTLDAPDAELEARMVRLIGQADLAGELAQSRRLFQKHIARHRRKIRALRQRNARLRRMAITDPLTGSRNGRYFKQWLSTQFEIARRYSLVLSVLVIDIDHFKRVNDSYGHPFGDFVLRQFAELLQQQVRSSDVVARCGGDEFVIGLVETGRREAIRFGRRLLRAVASQTFEYYGQTESITISVGHAGFPEDREATSAEQLILFADKALYQAKDNGRNDLACWHEIDPQERKRLASERTKASMPRLSGAPTIELLDSHEA